MNTRKVRIHRWLGAAVLALAGCTRQPVPEQADVAAPTVTPTPAPTAAAAAAPAPSSDAKPGSPVPQSGRSAGVRVFIDPATGEVRAPTRAEVAAANAAAPAGTGRVQAAGSVGQAASEGVQREHFVLPDGTEGVKLLPSDRHAVVVCRQADGSYGSHCPRSTGAAGP